MTEPSGVTPVNVTSLGLPPDVEKIVMKIAKEEGSRVQLDTAVEFFKAHLYLKSLESVSMPQAGRTEVVVWEQENGLVQYSIDKDDNHLIRRTTVQSKEENIGKFLNPELATDGASVFIIADSPKRGGSRLVNIPSERCHLELDFCRYSFWDEGKYYGMARTDYDGFFVEGGKLFVRWGTGDTTSINKFEASYCYHSLNTAVNTNSCQPIATQKPDGSYSFDNKVCNF